jgi:hypothetical protein
VPRGYGPKRPRSATVILNLRRWRTPVRSSPRSQAEVRELSTRATITATSFVNEYQWGDFKGSPDELMQRYYDAHLYFANWGTHRVMFRLPRTLLDTGLA